MLRRKLRYIILACALVLGTGTAAWAAGGPGPATALQQQQVSVCVYNNNTGTPCLNEWFGHGNIGNPIKMYQSGKSNETWTYNIIDRCNSGGVVTPLCPFTIGSGMNTEFQGDTIVQTPGPQGECLATASDASAVNGVCNDSTGYGGSTGTVEILTGNPDCIYTNWCQVVNLHWSDQIGHPQYECASSLSNGAAVYLDYATGACPTNTGWWFDF